MFFEDFRLNLDGVDIVIPHENLLALVELAILACDDYVFHLHVHKCVACHQYPVIGVTVFGINHHFGFDAGLLEDVQRQLKT